MGTFNYHEAWIHDMKVVSTVSAKGKTLYQFQHTKRLSKVDSDVVPQAQFHYDFEPFSIWVKADEKRWYDFMTSLLAMLGGAYVMMKLMSKGALSVFLLVKRMFPRARNVGRAGGMVVG